VVKKVTSSDNGDVEDGDNNPGGGNTPSGGGSNPSGGNPSGGSGNGDTTITTKPDGSGSEEGSDGKLEA